MQRSWNSSVCVMKIVSSSKQVLSCCFSTWNVECLPSGLVRRWPLSCQMKNCDKETENIMCHSVLVLLLISVQPQCMLFYKPSCKDQTRSRTINLLFQWLKKVIYTNQLEKKNVIYDSREKSFLSTHTFFLQSPDNNASIHFYVISWHSSLSWQRQLPCIN